MQKRCAKACDPCHRRKERCTGGIPCIQCARRNCKSDCQYGREADERAPKRRKLTNELLSTEAGICVPKIAEQVQVNNGVDSVVVGDSSTLALLSFVRRIGNSLNEDVELNCDDEVMLETSFRDGSGCSHTLLSNLAREEVQRHARSYVDFVHGVFDIFPETELFMDIDEWSPSKSTSKALTVASVPALTLILAIGAEQNGVEDLGNALFVAGYQQASLVMLKPPSLALVQSLMLLVLYLLVKCRRNAAFVLLGSAIQAGHSIGLYDFQSNQNTEARKRAWKCLRILDISSCASLGRSVTTVDMNRHTKIPRIRDDSVDSAALRLCSIAETVLRTVYAERSLTISFALKTSEELKGWADDLPVALVGPSASDELPDKPLHEQICANHMTAAYYWTIMLLTRPFLMNDTLSKSACQVSEQTNTPQALFVDACIDSAFRCLEANMVLLKYPNLPHKLFLVVNTTLVSALVLVLAIFGDYDRTVPIEQGLEYAEIFLKHLSGRDLQAAQYLKFVQAQRHAASRYCKKRAAAEMDRRAAQVHAMFGAVRPVGTMSDIQAMYNTNEASGQPKGQDPSCAPDCTADVEENWSLSFLDFMSSTPDLTDLTETRFAHIVNHEQH